MLKLTHIACASRTASPARDDSHPGSRRGYLSAKAPTIAQLHDFLRTAQRWFARQEESA